MDTLRAWATPIVGAATVAACVWAAAAWQRCAARRKHDKVAQDRWRPLHASPTRVPLPGELLVRDFRSGHGGGGQPQRDTDSTGGSSTAGSGGAGVTAGCMRVVVWNIERGKKIARVIEELRALNADVLVLQEVDIGCRRSHHADIGAEIARALSMNVVYANEMDGVDAAGKTRDKQARASADQDAQGSEGNAILSRYNIADTRVLQLACVRNRFKTQHAHIKQHCCPVVDLDTPLGRVTFVSVHLDAFSGRAARKAQFEPVLRLAAEASLPTFVGGDLNTHNSGVALLVNQYAGGDPHRWSLRNVVEHESAWWRRHVFSSRSGRGALLPAFEHDAATVEFGGGWVFGAKLDWALCTPQLHRSIIHKAVAPTFGGDGASDHSYLVVDFAPCDGSGQARL